MNGGVLLIDKPRGPTSHDVVTKVRRVLKTKRVGHAGTLDPMASGLLFLCVDDATRLLEYMTAKDKTYTGEIVFGIGTDTDDAEGNIIDVKPVSHFDLEQIGSAVGRLTGRIEQEVPRYSAVHIQGKRAYEFARAGQQVDMPSRSVVVESFTVGNLSVNADVARASFTVKCSKGTYIRALCRDLGKILKVPAHMSKLRRIGIGRTSVDDALSLEDLATIASARVLVTDPMRYLSEYAQVDVSLADVNRLVTGQQIDATTYSIVDSTTGDDRNGVVLVCHYGELVAVTKAVDDEHASVLQPVKVFWKKG